jgi:hypothetical protein
MLQKHLGIKFLYADGGSPVEIADLKSGKTRLTPSDLAALPKEIIMKLLSSAAALEMDTTLKIIEEIREHDEPLSEALKKLAEEYRFDKLQKLLDQDNQ